MLACPVANGSGFGGVRIIFKKATRESCEVSRPRARVYVRATVSVSMSRSNQAGRCYVHAPALILRTVRAKERREPHNKKKKKHSCGVIDSHTGHCARRKKLECVHGGPPGRSRARGDAARRPTAQTRMPRPRGQSQNLSIERCCSLKALFTCNFFFCKIEIVVVSFVFDKYCSIMD